MKRKFVVQVTMTVDDLWIEDGFDLNSRESIKDFQEFIQRRIPYAYSHEFKVKAKLISGPDKKTVRKLQGYAN